MSCGSNEMLRFSITTFSLIPVGSPRGSFFARAKFNPFVWNRKLCFLFRVKKQTIFQVYWFDLPKPFIFPVLLDKCMFVCVCARAWFRWHIYSVFLPFSIIFRVFPIAQQNLYCQNQLFPNECHRSFGKIHFSNLLWVPPFLSRSLALLLLQIYLHRILRLSLICSFVPGEKIQSIT